MKANTTFEMNGRIQVEKAMWEMNKAYDLIQKAQYRLDHYLKEHFLAKDDEVAKIKQHVTIMRDAIKNCINQSTIAEEIENGPENKT
jgi:hypothetical protein